MSGTKKATPKTELYFVEDKELKRTIEDSIQYLYLIFEQAKDSKSDLYKEETYRVIVLYIISIIEAILLYVLKKCGDEIKTTQYKYVQPLPKEFKHANSDDSPIVVAVQKEEVKSERTIGLSELVTYMEKQGLMGKNFATKILDMNDIRNTFHFTKPRNKITCEIETVENALELLVETIKKAPKAISHRV